MSKDKIKRNLYNFKNFNLKLFSVLISLVIVLCGMTFTASADSKTIKVGRVENDDIMDIDKNGTVYGYGADFLNEISNYTDWNYEFLSGSEDECLEWLKQGEIDLLFPVEYTHNREKDFLFSDYECCVDYVSLLTTLNNKKLYYDEPECYRGITVGFVENNLLNKNFREYAKENNFSYKSAFFNTELEMYNALNNGMLDAIVTGNVSFTNNLKLLVKIDYMPTYFITEKSNKSLMNTLNSALESIMLDNPSFTDDLIKKYYGNSYIKSFTKAESDLVSRMDTLNVVGDPNNNPFEWYDKTDNTYKGVAVEIIKQIAENCGLRIRYINTSSLSESWDLIKEGKADIISGVYIDHNVANDYNLYNTVEYLTENMTAISRSDKALYETDNLTVILKTPFIGLQHYIASNYPNWDIISADTSEECLNAVEIGKADACFISSLEIQTDTILTEYPELQILPTISIDLPIYLGISQKHDKTLVSAVNKGIWMLTEQDINRITVDNTVINSDNFSIKKIIRYNPILFSVIVIAFFMLLMGILFFILRAKSKARQATLLKEKNSQLEIANRAKSDFLSRISHDMRTPMNGIIGILNLLSDSPDVTDDVEDDLNKIEKSCNYLLELINDTLDIDRIEKGKLVLTPEIVELGEIIDEVVDIIKPNTDYKNILLNCVFECDKTLFVRTDKMRTKQILINILSNAYKFTPSNGRIDFVIKQLKLQADSVILKFTVTDNGIGMSEKYLPKLFESFSQEDNSTTSSYSGTGLGMSIVKNILDLMGGEISVKSKKGKGTTFDIILNLEVVKDYHHNRARTPAEVDISGTKILLCEDHPLNAEIAIKLLNKKGCIVKHAVNGQEGVEFFSQSNINHFDIILMDIRMPIMDGLQATKIIRAMPRLDAKEIPIVAMTANTYSEDEDNSKKAGIDKHLSKPINPNELFLTIYNFLHK